MSLICYNVFVVVFLTDIMRLSAFMSLQLAREAMSVFVVIGP